MLQTSPIPEAFSLLLYFFPKTFFTPLTNNSTTNPANKPTTNSTSKSGTEGKRWCRNGRLCTKIPPETRSKAMVPITESDLITHGRAFTKNRPIMSVILLSSPLRRIKRAPNSSIRTISATRPYTPTVARNAIKDTTRI